MAEPAESLKAMSETTIIQPQESVTSEKQLGPGSEIPGDIKAPAGTLGATLKDARLVNTQSVGQNAVPATRKQAPWPQPMKSADMTGGVTYEWLKDVTSRLTTLEGGKTKDESKKTDTKDEAPIIQSLKTEPKVRDCNWEEFKNRYSPEEATFAIEVLLAGDDLRGEMGEEQLRRLPTDKRDELIESSRKKPLKKPPVDQRPDSHRLERVRINSTAVLSFLGAITGEPSGTEKPFTFLRPFRTLIHFHDRLEEEFAELEGVFEENSRLQQGSVEEAPLNTAEDRAAISGGESRDNAERGELPSQGSTITTDTPKPAAKLASQEQPVEDNTSSQKKPGLFKMKDIGLDGYMEIKCYMEFARARLLPTYRRFEGKDHSQRLKIRFDELWSLYRIGELVFSPEDSKTKSWAVEARNSRSLAGRPKSRRLWRLYYISPDTVDWTVENLEGKGGNLRRSGVEKNGSMRLYAYYIDYNGVSYTGAGRIWTIKRFEGEKDVTKLELYPTRFEKDYEITISRMVESGKKFQDLLLSSETAVQHDGWTLTHDPVGEQLDDEDGKTTAEYVDSDVIIDFHEAYQTNPSWRPNFSYFIKPTFESETTYDEFAIIQWSGPDRSKQTGKSTEIVLSFDDVNSLQSSKFLDVDNFIGDPDARPTEIRQARRRLYGEDLALLPSRMFVYSLRNRKFINADVQNLKSIEVVLDPFGDLKIEEPHKRLIRSVVQDHFDKKSVQRQLRAQDIEPLEQDFIRGKGKGLVIMLHGAPGVGKTATAEAIASAHRKPLFAITCGDLGIDPREVESTLSEIFRLANLWDCILLLDEAEIFLSRREKKDDNLQRNALVSIFLRTLEYYPGILFLTTNRVGVLDEALNSRVHMSIYFRHLDAEQTMALFDMNLKRSEMIAEQRAMSTKEPPLLIKAEEIRGFALTHFAKHAGGPGGLGTWWNGRQIRNAFQIATSLAYADARDQKDDEKRYLGREHFDQVLQAMEEYTQYRQDLLHKTDDDLAADREERYSRVGGDNSGRRESPRYGPIMSQKPVPTAIGHFDSTAAQYEASTGGCTRELAQLLLDVPQLQSIYQSGATVLDNACGTGIVAQEIILRAHRTNANVPKIHAVDPAPNMVEISRKKLDALGVPTTSSTAVMPGEKLEFQNEMFTHSITNLGILFFTDGDAGAKEIYRTLKPGGVAVVTSWAVLGYLQVIRPAQSAVRPDDPPFKLPIPEKWFDPAFVGKCLKDGGFANVTISESIVHYGAPSVEDLLGLILNSFKMLWKDWSEEEQSKFHQVAR
ncbi:AAA domain-containing protein [Fusarium sp. LHS14.1]|nr:AAA domain-containing protein [Fusarium sp. LHS14.1]